MAEMTQSGLQFGQSETIVGTLPSTNGSFTSGVFMLSALDDDDEVVDLRFETLLILDLEIVETI